jgi:hypothetical protein
MFMPIFDRPSPPDSPAKKPVSYATTLSAHVRTRGPVALLLVAMSIFGATCSAHAQARPAATKDPVQLGATFSFGNPDYTETYIKGYTIYGDYSIFRRLALEGEYHDLTWKTPDGVGEYSVVAGPRYSFAIEDRARLYVKALGGVGRIQFQKPKPNAGTDTYAVFAPGAGVEFRATHHINIRAIDFEYQLWPGFRPSGLSPWVASTGAAWMF